MFVTIYELLGMVKDGKAPKKIKYINSIWEYDEETKDYVHDDLWLIYSMNSIGLTERKVEILEEEKKIPEKLGECACVDGEIAYSWSKSEAKLKTKINEIIDYLKSKGDK